MAFAAEMAEFHWKEQQAAAAVTSSASGDVDSTYALVQRSFKPAPPALYLLPSGPGGVQTQASALLVVEGVNVLMGAAFAAKPGGAPLWWDLVKSLDR